MPKNRRMVADVNDFPCTAVSRAILLIVIIAGAARSVRAQSETASPTTIDQLKALNDQTILQSRVWLDTEWDQYKRGAVEGTWTFGGAWTWRGSDVQDWIVRGTLPVVVDRSDDASGNTIVGGLGDIEIASGTAF